VSRSAPRYGAFGTIVATPAYQWLTQQGTFTFTVNDLALDGSSAQQAYSITVAPPLPLTITTPSTMSSGTVTMSSRTVGQQYNGLFSESGLCRLSHGRWSPGSSHPASRWPRGALPR
jgi:hypothetical protein